MQAAIALRKNKSHIAAATAPPHPQPPSGSPHHDMPHSNPRSTDYDEKRALRSASAEAISWTDTASQYHSLLQPSWPLQPARIHK